MKPCCWFWATADFILLTISGGIPGTSKASMVTFDCHLPGRTKLPLPLASRTLAATSSTLAFFSSMLGELSHAEIGNAQARSRINLVHSLSPCDACAHWPLDAPAGAIRSSTAATIAMVPVVIAGWGSTLKKLLWCDGTGGPPAFSASNAACGVPPTLK